MKTADLITLTESLRGLRLPQNRVYDVIMSHIAANTRIVNLERMLLESRSQNDRLTKRMAKIEALAKGEA